MHYWSLDRGILQMNSAGNEKYYIDTIIQSTCEAEDADLEAACLSFQELRFFPIDSADFYGCRLDASKPVVLEERTDILYSGDEPSFPNLISCMFQQATLRANPQLGKECATKKNGFVQFDQRVASLLAKYVNHLEKLRDVLDSETALMVQEFIDKLPDGIMRQSTITNCKNE